MDLNERRQLPLFSIGTVQKLTGLSARQIRYYEEHGLVFPARSEGKQRQFSFDDVERLMLIREWMDAGDNMATVKGDLPNSASVQPTPVGPRASPSHQIRRSTSGSNASCWRVPRRTVRRCCKGICHGFIGRSNACTQVVFKRTCIDKEGPCCEETIARKKFSHWRRR